MIREATPADAPALAGLQRRAWWRAYAEWVDPECFGSLEERVARWGGHLAPAALRTTLVFDVDGVPAGLASVGPARGADAAPGVGELMALYVDPPAQGAGVGGALLAAGQARLVADGHAEAVLWVFVGNEQARDLYERRGWRQDADSEREDAWGPEVRYRLAL